MRKSNYFKLRFFLGIAFLVCGIFFWQNQVQASSSDNVSGFAWSENVGWISFNNISGGGSESYGANVDFGNGKFSGYAWSESIGWVSFNESDTGVPPSGDPCSDSSCIAKATPSGQLGKGNVSVTGWARALAWAGGWDGWIKFDHNQANKVYIDASGDFHGWAWGSDVVGWISFNCLDQGVCGVSNYKVTLNLTGINNPPSAINLSATLGECCGAPYPPFYLSWDFYDPDVGDTQSAYQVQVDNNPDFSSVEKDSGKVASASETYAPVSLSYNTTYYWRVRVWDSQDLASLNWAVGTSFTTPSHCYPTADLSWQPQNPIINQNVLFQDESTACVPATIAARFWTFEGGIPLSSTLQSPIVKFSSAGSKEITLRVTDSDGYSCQSDIKIINVQQSPSPPEWKEVPPISKWNSFLSSIIMPFKQPLAGSWY